MSPPIPMRSLLPLSMAACCLLLLLLVPRASASTAAHPPAAACNGSIAQCMAAAEFLVDSETNRRMLQDAGHIGYGSLQPNKPTCDAGRGKSYTNTCVPPPSNRPSRPCYNYYRCRTGDSF